MTVRIAQNNGNVTVTCDATDDAVIAKLQGSQLNGTSRTDGGFTFTGTVDQLKAAGLDISVDAKTATSSAARFFSDDASAYTCAPVGGNDIQCSTGEPSMPPPASPNEGAGGISGSGDTGSTGNRGITNGTGGTGGSSGTGESSGNGGTGSGTGRSDAGKSSGTSEPKPVTSGNGAQPKTPAASGQEVLPPVTLSNITGTKKQTLADGSVQLTFTDGRVFTVKPDGTRIEQYPEGNVVITKPSGEVEGVRPRSALVYEQDPSEEQRTKDSACANEWDQVVRENRTGRSEAFRKGNIILNVSALGGYSVSRDDIRQELSTKFGAQFDTLRPEVKERMISSVEARAIALAKQQVARGENVYGSPRVVISLKDFVDGAKASPSSGATSRGDTVPPSASPPTPPPRPAGGGGGGARPVARSLYGSNKPAW